MRLRGRKEKGQGTRALESEVFVAIGKEAYCLEDYDMAIC